MQQPKKQCSQQNNQPAKIGNGHWGLRVKKLGIDPQKAKKKPMRWHSEAGPCCCIKKLPQKGASTSMKKNLPWTLKRKRTLQ